MHMQNIHHTKAGSAETGITNSMGGKQKHTGENEGAVGAEGRGALEYWEKKG